MNGEHEHVCPYLGLAEDPDTPRSYPSQWNRCFHVKPAAPLALEHQYEYCLSPGYPECEVYKGELAASLPKDIRGKQFGDAKSKKYLISIGTILTVLILVGLIFWPGSANGVLRLFRGGSSTNIPTSSAVTMATPSSTIHLVQAKATIIPRRSSPTYLLSKTTTLTPTASFTSTKTKFFLWNSLVTPSPTSQPGGKVPSETPIPTNTPVPPTYTPVPPTTVPPTQVLPTNTFVPPTPVPTSVNTPTP
jgi:hypothetical protein